MRTFMLCIAVATVLAGCTSAVHMRNAATGATATCGPYADTINAPAYEHQCISDYQRQGFERVSD